MQVNVLVSNGVGDGNTPILVTLFGEDAAIPQHLLAMHWRSLATADTDDRLIRARRLRIEAEIACRGYSLLTA
jgi:hypothetical protein